MDFIFKGFLIKSLGMQKNALNAVNNIIFGGFSVIANMDVDKPIVEL